MDAYTNILKPKYVDMDAKILRDNSDVPKETFLLINLNYLFDKLELFFKIKNDDISILNSDIVVYNVLNLIAHYRYYFYKYLKSNNNIILFVNEQQFTYKSSLKLLRTFCEFFPKIRFITTNNVVYTKYHCVKEILYVFRNKERKFYWFDIDKQNLLINYLTTGNYYRLRIVGMKSYITDEVNLCKELGLDDSYKYDCKYYIPFIQVAHPGKRLSDKLKQFIIENSTSNISDREKNINFNRLYGKPEYEDQINEIFDIMNSKNMRDIVRGIFKVWGHHIHTKEIMNFNDIIDTRNIDVQVDKLFCTND